MTAETLYEAAVLGMKALQVGRNAATLTIDVTVRAPETTHTISTAALSVGFRAQAGAPGSKRSNHGCGNCWDSRFGPPRSTRILKGAGLT